MEAKYLELAREIWAEMTHAQRAEALKPVDWQAEMARMEKEALQGLRDELAKMPARSPFDFYDYRIVNAPATLVSSAPAVPEGA